jgi:hypothetical protein
VLLAWYRADEEVAAKLPLLSTSLGHVDPAATYWYLSAAPELLGLAAERLEGRGDGRDAPDEAYLIATGEYPRRRLAAGARTAGNGPRTRNARLAAIRSLYH